LLAEDWHVEADGKLYRTPGAARMNVISGIDWFDLEDSIEYGGQRATFGQTRQVFAYRLIARDTVEEKVLALQQSKRALADAFLDDGSLVRALSREDLEFLLQ